jgi:hypothetical protein
MKGTNKMTIESKKRKADFEAIKIAAQDERDRVNEALRCGKKAIIETHSGLYKLIKVSNDWWYLTIPVDSKGNVSIFDGQHSWCGCNDSIWADIMEQLNVERNPRWIK